jgi:hypothetical protein
MRPIRRSRSKIKANKQAVASKWVTHGNLAVIRIAKGTAIENKLLASLSAEAEIYSESLGVVIVPEIDMRMNIQGRYENCLFVTQPNAKKLIAALNRSLDALADASPNGMIAGAALLKLRNSSEILALCLNYKINDSADEEEKADTPSRILHRRAPRYLPKGQSDPNTYYQLPDLRKYQEEEEDFRGHHDKPE